MQDVATAVHLLPIRVDTIEKAPGVFLQHVADARGLDDVDPDVAWIAHARTPSAARRVVPGEARRVARASGLCASRGPHGAPRHGGTRSPPRWPPGGGGGRRPGPSPGRDRPAPP